MIVGLFDEMTKKASVGLGGIGGWPTMLIVRPGIVLGERRIVSQKNILSRSSICSKTLSRILLRAVLRLFGKNLRDVIVIHDAGESRMQSRDGIGRANQMALGVNAKRLMQTNHVIMKRERPG